MYEVPYNLIYQVFWGRILSFKEGKDILWLWGKNITWIKGKGKQYHLLYDIEAVGKNIKLGKVEGDGNFGEENRDLNKIGWERISSCSDLFTPLKGIVSGR